ncbi:hypothetical protein [Thermomonospora umbrina]|uniref:Uncharacterized protein n=1 Tax=Thermomonospora umbrina TaxID=111806 RepID=A0A3D9SPD3_9ACTN|nr:hypothetical protein [Thermomonospora umbrina]REE95823.1 hypothetical protein DFJ69_1236 [Thermomonospora umbrina]
MRVMIRRTASAAVTVMAATGLAAVIPATAHAAGPCSNSIVVLERTFTVDWRGALIDRANSGYGYDLRAGHSIEVVGASGEIWAGVAFTGRNGPDGWRNWPAPDDGRWPLPGADLYSLVGTFKDRQTGFERGTFPVGTGTGGCVPVPAGGTSVLYLRHNDQYTLDNDGAFTARVRIWRRI